MKKMLFILLLCLALTASAIAETAVYTAKQVDESAVDVSGDEQATLTGVTILKTGGNASSADAASFRGVNAAVSSLSNVTGNGYHLYANGEAVL